MKKSSILRLQDPDALRRCIDFLSVMGAVALVPTDTVYGLICRWGDLAALDVIRRMKGQCEDKPFQMLAPDSVSAESAGAEFTPLVRALTDAFTPGPITVITGGRGGGTIGFRIPDFPFLACVMQGIGANLAATSANPAGVPPITSVPETDGLFAPPPPLIIDGGKLAAGTASTVVDASKGEVRILREGPITSEMILRVVDHSP